MTDRRPKRELTDSNINGEALSNAYVHALDAEREYVARLYLLLEKAESEAGAQMRAALSDNTALDGWEQSQRQARVNSLGTQVRRLREATGGLCFGRLDRADGEIDYIGRIGLSDDEEADRQALVDWRAPAARLFYTATFVASDGLLRRRHFRMLGRHLAGFHDDVFDIRVDGMGAGDGSALLAALDAPRESGMRDIVATIQSEQDAIIRSDVPGLMVIEGGPGTGKTAVALHRVAYLLYSRRASLARSGVLVVGPTPELLDYIADVLPSLGESDVVMMTPGTFYPGVRTTARDSPECARVKGSLAMVDVLAAAVADRQELPAQPIPIDLSDIRILLDRRVASRARDHARATGLLHNDARKVFFEWVIDGLATKAVDKIGSGWLSPDDTELRAGLIEDIRRECAESLELRAAVDRLWPFLTPARLLADLYTSRARIRAAAGAVLPPGDLELLYREGGETWTSADAPLLDEAAELLGVDRSAERAEARRRQQEVEYAKGVLQILDTATESEDEVLRATDVIDPDELAERHTEREIRSLAERAVADREWTYGHVVIDEAQELSEMDWRILMRRCPSKSMTIVGDLAQRESRAGAHTWSAMLDRYAPGRWVYQQLTVNYRTPAEIMDAAGQAVRAGLPGIVTPRSVRSNGITPRVVQIAPERLWPTVARITTDLASHPGTTGVIAPPDIARNHPSTLEVLVPHATKGLEFDNVVIVEPQDFLPQGRAGYADLYVALTRATQRLVIVHTSPLPAPMRAAFPAEDLG